MWIRIICIYLRHYKGLLDIFAGEKIITNKTMAVINEAA